MLKFSGLISLTCGLTFPGVFPKIVFKGRDMAPGRGMAQINATKDNILITRRNVKLALRVVLIASDQIRLLIAAKTTLMWKDITLHIVSLNVRRVTIYKTIILMRKVLKLEPLDHRHQPWLPLNVRLVILDVKIAFMMLIQVDPSATIV